jgi:hypothetical protein
MSTALEVRRVLCLHHPTALVDLHRLNHHETDALPSPRQIAATVSVAVAWASK